MFLKKALLVFILYFCFSFFHNLIAFAGEPVVSLNNFELIKNQLTLSKLNLDKALELLDQEIISQKEYESLKEEYTKLKSTYDILQNSNPSDINGNKISLNADNSTKISNFDKPKSKKISLNDYYDLYDLGIISRKELIDFEVDYRYTVLINNNPFLINNSEMFFENLDNPYNITIKSPIKFISSRYGYRNHPITNNYLLHSGVDIASIEGASVLAYGDGVVKRASFGFKNGNFVEIQHGNGFSSLYLHLKCSLVKVNQFVKKGDEIGLVGSTGLSTGSHLHFELRKDNVSLNINSLCDKK